MYNMHVPMSSLLPLQTNPKRKSHAANRGPLFVKENKMESPAGTAVKLIGLIRCEPAGAGVILLLVRIALLLA